MFKLIIYTQSILKGNEYRNHKFVVGFDTENMLGLACTGADTKNSVVTTKLKTNGGDYQASRTNVVLVTQQSLEVSDSGVTLASNPILSY